MTQMIYYNSDFICWFKEMGPGNVPYVTSRCHLILSNFGNFYKTCCNKGSKWDMKEPFAGMAFPEWYCSFLRHLGCMTQMNFAHAFMCDLLCVWPEKATSTSPLPFSLTHIYNFLWRVAKTIFYHSIDPYE